MEKINFNGFQFTVNEEGLIIEGAEQFIFKHGEFLNFKEIFGFDHGKPKNAWGEPSSGGYGHESKFELNAYEIEKDGGLNLVFDEYSGEAFFKTEGEFMDMISEIL